MQIYKIMTFFELYAYEDIRLERFRRKDIVQNEDETFIQGTYIRLGKEI